MKARTTSHNLPRKWMKLGLCLAALAMDLPAHAKDPIYYFLTDTEGYWDQVQDLVDAGKLKFGPDGKSMLTDPDAKIIHNGDVATRGPKDMELIDFLLDLNRQGKLIQTSGNRDLFHYEFLFFEDQWEKRHATPEKLNPKFREWAAQKILKERGLDPKAPDFAEKTKAILEGTDTSAQKQFSRNLSEKENMLDWWLTTVNSPKTIDNHLEYLASKRSTVASLLAEKKADEARTLALRDYLRELKTGRIRELNEIGRVLHLVPSGEKQLLLVHSAVTRDNFLLVPNRAPQEMDMGNPAHFRRAKNHQEWVRDLNDYLQKAKSSVEEEIRLGRVPFASQYQSSVLVNPLTGEPLKNEKGEKIPNKFSVVYAEPKAYEHFGPGANLGVDRQVAEQLANEGVAGDLVGHRPVGNITHTVNVKAGEHTYTRYFGDLSYKDPDVKTGIKEIKNGKLISTSYMKDGTKILLEQEFGKPHPYLGNLLKIDGNPYYLAGRAYDPKGKFLGYAARFADNFDKRERIISSGELSKALRSLEQAAMNCGGDFSEFKQ